MNRELMNRELMNRALRTTVARAFRRTALPLAAYYTVTLAVPLANGAARSGGTFVDHALIVLVIPPALIVCACAVHIVTGSLRPARLSRRGGA
jgi:hypothetical protein